MGLKEDRADRRWCIGWWIMAFSWVLFVVGGVMPLVVDEPLTADARIKEVRQVVGMLVPKFGSFGGRGATVTTFDLNGRELSTNDKSVGDLLRGKEGTTVRVRYRAHWSLLGKILRGIPERYEFVDLAP